LIILFSKYLVRISSNNRGQIEIDLNKQIEQMWKSIGKFSSKHLSVCLIQDFGMYTKNEELKFFFSLEPIYFPATLIQRSPVTHDTDWYTFSLPSNVSMSPPIGYHIRLKRIEDGSIIDFLFPVFIVCFIQVYRL
jgi:hypothetical protein